MPPTPEQHAADEAVSQALLDRAIAYGNDEPGGIVTGWFAVAAETRYVDDEPVTAYRLCTPYEQPVHVDLGLLAYATERVRSWTWPTPDDD